MIRVKSDGQGSVQLFDGRRRGLTYKEQKHIRWNLELTDNPEMGKYNFVLYGSDFEVNPAHFVSNLFGEWGHFSIDTEERYKKRKFNSRFSYQLFIVNSDRAPSSLHFDHFKEYKKIEDKSLNSKNSLGLEGYVENLYGKNK